MKRRDPYNEIIGTADWQQLLGLIRLILAMACILVLGIFGAVRLDGMDPVDLAEKFRLAHPLFQHIKPVLIIFAAVLNWNTIRYMIAPTFAILFVLTAGAFYVKDVYNLAHLREAITYITASLFAMNYSLLVVDKGVKQVDKSGTNLIDSIGGPGFVVIEPGNAAMFRTLRKPSRVSLNSTYFLAPFETLAQAMDLDDQQGDKDEISAMTRDGIRVSIRDVHFRYRIKQQVRNGAPAQKSLQDPYPYDDEALRNIAFNLTVSKNGLETWNATVERMVVGAISDFVSGHTVDYLTAPIDGTNNPQVELRNELFSKGFQGALANVGAELLWADGGHLHIVEEAVDDQRADLWAADWVGDANVTRAYGEAKRLAYQELGRAEAQAELIMSITDALSESVGDQSPAEVIRRLLLARTAQVLDALSSQENTQAKDGK